jgi:pyruvate dehydrogenase E1 component alpha subunit
MHLFGKEVNMWGSSAVVGGSVPIAVGMGLALKQKETDDICISFTGDAGTEEGAYYESLNLAALLNVPVLFVVENNSYSTLTALRKRQASPDIVRKANSFGVDGISVDGNDAEKVHETSLDVMENIRKKQEPFLLEAMTYRMCAHVGPGFDFGDGNRPTAEYEYWKKLDPIERLRTRITRHFPDRIVDMEKIEETVGSTVDYAFESAKQKFGIINAEARLAAPGPPRSQKSASV